MILIDKKKFIEEVKKRKYSSASIKLIEEQPEVEAIPYKWIIAWGVANCYDFGTIHNTVTNMLDAWDKEHDKQ